MHPEAEARQLLEIFTDSQQMVTTVTNNQNFIINAMQHNEERNHFTMIFSNYALTTMILAAMVHDFVVPVVWQLGVKAGMLTL